VWGGAVQHGAESVPPEKPYCLLTGLRARGGGQRQKKTQVETSAGTDWIIGGRGWGGKADDAGAVQKMAFMLNQRP
jgi:hypothetical protein